jgi:hypothetical protein
MSSLCLNKLGLSLSGAKLVVAKAIEEAVRNGWVVTVGDQSTNPSKMTLLIYLCFSDN